jgi:putative copper resistance protein D
MRLQFDPYRQLLSLPLILALICFISALSPHAAAAQDHSTMHHDHDGMSMSMDEPLDPAAQAKLLRDKKESEFNHHLAGLFVVLAGIFILAESRLRNRWPAVRYAWPLCFLLSGIFVLVFSDTELWPFGPKHWWVGVTGNLEVMQHKTFAVILLGLGIVELRRAQGSLRAAWSAWVFPVLAVIGSIMLLFHAHDAGMHGADAMTAMHRIQLQHFSYAAIGAGIGISKGLSDMQIPGRQVFRYIWPVLMIALGVLLMLYSE